MIGKVLRLEGGVIVVPLYWDSIIEEFECIVVDHPDRPQYKGRTTGFRQEIVESAVEYKLFGRSQRSGKPLPNLRATGYGAGPKGYVRFSVETK